MFKRIALAGKKVSIFSVFILLSLFIRGHLFAEDMTFHLVQGLNGISLPFEGTGITNAEELCRSIPPCEEVSYWDAPTQSLITYYPGSQYNNFPVVPGYPYFVNVFQNTDWTVSGSIPSYFLFNLITTNTTDINTISLPIDRLTYITNAEELVNDILHADTVWRWDASIQGYVGHPKGSEINNFPVYPGYPYFVNVTGDSVWPDSTPPDINITYPLDGTSIKTATPNITITFSDSDSGIDTGSFYAGINGVDSTSLFTVTSTGASYQVATALPAGGNTITAGISDNAGNTASATSNFTVAVLRAIPGASPTSGPSPLTVHFTTNGEDPAGTIEVFRWDFDGNGSWDTYDTVAKDYNYIYYNSGTYNATLYVQSSTGKTATASITITVLNNPPVAAADMVPSNGQVPLTVQCIGSGTDSDGQVVLYEWDYDGDGTFDWSSPTTGNTTYTYITPGTYQAVFRVTDNDGLTTTALPPTTIVRAGPPGSPTATASANPTSGDAPLTVNFSGTATDPDGNIALYEWDFDGDGVYDWSSPTSGNTSHIYYAAGTHVASFRVTDSTGLTGIDQLLITVNIRVSLSIQKDTVGYLGGPQITGTNINTSISAATQVTIIIKDSVGNIVRTLVDNESRSQGSYADYWDVEDDFGFVVNDGVHYAVLQYVVDKQIRTYDLTDSTGGTRYSFPFGSGCNARSYFSSPFYFSPFDDDFMPMTFSLCTAQEVTAFIGPLWGGADETRVRTILNREVFPAGTHTIYWDGLDDNGKEAKAPPGDTLITGFWRYSLPDNAIVVTGGKPSIINISAEPNYFSPFSEKCDLNGNGEGVAVSYTVSEDVANVELRVYSIDTGDLLATRVVGNVLAGDNVIFWDGFNNKGEYVDIGDYRIGITAVDAQGNKSMFRYALVRIDY